MQIDTERGIAIGLFTGSTASVLLGTYLLHSPVAVDVGGIAFAASFLYGTHVGDKSEMLKRKQEKEECFRKGYAKGLEER